MLVIVIISIIIYSLAAIVIYHNINAFNKQQKIKYIIAGMLVTLVLTIIICSITSAQINIAPKELIKITKTTAILIFAPLNSIILLPFVGSTLSKYKDEQIDEKKMKKRMTIEMIILIITIIIELNYIKNFQIGLLSSRG